ncbi:UDP-N-acetylmuramate dehydrogenase [soil metagenome]
MKIIENADLSEILWYKIGGRAKYLLEVSSKEDILAALSLTKEKHIGKIFICGLGANLLFTDEYFDGAVIRFVPKKEKQITLIEGNKLEVYAGELLDRVITIGFDLNLIGLAWAGGLPGTVGAAVRGNVGAFGGEIKDVIESVDVVRLESSYQKIETLTKEELAFAYRTSSIKIPRRMIVLSARFVLHPASAYELEKAKEVYFDHIAYRKENHPNSFPNSGSVFKNIARKEQVGKILAVYPDIQELVNGKWHGKVSMGYLNNLLGFSGLTIGGAKVSEQHANFIDNIGHAKATDVIAIIETIQRKFEETFDFIPEPEVEIVR